MALRRAMWAPISSPIVSVDGGPVQWDEGRLPPPFSTPSNTGSPVAQQKVPSSLFKRPFKSPFTGLRGVKKENG